jgi:uncharacterized phiE125 gp8 family phage protein
MTKYAPVLVDGPDVLPVLLEDVKRHLRVDGDDEDDLIEIYLRAAVTHLDGAEGWLGRAIVAQTWSQQFDAFARSISIDLSPISEIDSVTYLDADGVVQTVAESDYALINGSTASPELRFDDGFSFPATQDQRPVLTVTFVGGYGDDSAAPEPIKVGIMMMVADMYQSRESKVDNGLMVNPTVRMLLDPYRTRWMA